MWISSLIHPSIPLPFWKIGYAVNCAEESFSCEKCIISVGRSGSKWMERICNELEIPTKSNRVDLGVRVELPAEVFLLI